MRLWLLVTNDEYEDAEIYDSMESIQLALKDRYRGNGEVTFHSLKAKGCGLEQWQACITHNGAVLTYTAVLTRYNSDDQKCGASETDCRGQKVYVGDEVVYIKRNEALKAEKLAVSMIREITVRGGNIAVVVLEDGMTLLAQFGGWYKVPKGKQLETVQQG